MRKAVNEGVNDELVEEEGGETKWLLAKVFKCVPLSLGSEAGKDNKIGERFYFVFISFFISFLFRFYFVF